MAGVSNPTVEHDAKTRGIILHIVEQIKSQGVFDRFRRDCLEELDSKEPYRQLKQRVESHVATFLSKQMFSANLPKNQLRTSLRSNINQSEVLSKGVDRLLEQVLDEKSGSFYKEIENLVEEHLISTGHYTRYERDKSQKSDRDGQPRSEHTKLSDKEVEDIIKEETNRLLEASADGKFQELDRNSIADSPPPGTSGEIIEVETLFGNDNGDQERVQISQTAASSTNLVDASVNSSKTAYLSQDVNRVEKQGKEMSQSEKAVLKVKTEENQQADEPSVSDAQNADESLQSQSDSNRGQEIFAQISEPGNSACANSNESSQVTKLQITTGSNPASSSETPDASLPDKTEAIGIEVEPSSSTKNTSAHELQRKKDENIHVLPEIERSKDYKPAVGTRDAGATIGQTTITEQRDLIPEESIAEVDSQVVGPGSNPEESKANANTNVNVQTAADKVEMNNAKIHKPKPENPEMFETEAAKPRMVKPEVVKPEVVKPDVVRVSKPSVDKSRKAEEKATAKQTTAAEHQNQLSSKQSTKPATEKSLSNLFSTDEETDEDIVTVPGSKPEKGKPEISAQDIAELSDSDITVSSVHTSDLSSLEDSMSDMEFEDYQEFAQKKREEKKSGESSVATSKKIESTEIDEENRSGAATSKKNDYKEKIQERKFDQAGSTISMTTDSKEKESGASTSVKIDSTEINEEKKYGTDTSVKIDTQENVQERKSDQACASTNVNIVIKDRKEGKESCDSDATTRKNIGSEEKSEEKKSCQFDTVSSKEIVSEDKSEKKKSSADIVEKIDSDEEHGEKKYEDGAATSRKINSTEETTVELAGSSSDSVPTLESSPSSSQKHEPERSEATESTLPASSEDENQSCVQETSTSMHEASAPALFKGTTVPAAPQDFETAGSHDSELVCAQAAHEASDADNETALEDSDLGNNKLGKRRHSRRISTEQESESSNETSTPPGEQKEPQPQRRSARVASKDKTRPDEKEDNRQEDTEELQKSEEGGDSLRRLRRKRNSEEKSHDVRAPRSKEERRNERAEKRATRATSDSNDSDIKPSKRSKRKVRPTRCYSPSENS